MKYSNQMKQLFSIIIISIVALVVISPVVVHAQIQHGNGQGRGGQNAMKENKASDSAKGNSKARIRKGTITAINDTSLTVTSGGNTTTVTTSPQTVLRRRWGGIATLNEYAVNNIVDVRGTFTDAAKTTIAATNIRNHSILKRKGAFIGNVVTVDEGTIVVRTKNRGDLVVTFDSSVIKYVNRKQQPITLNDIKVGHRIRVKGVWDKSNNTISQATQIKDFSLPPKGNASVSATPTAEPTEADL
jgi:hypothetical protein